MDLWSPLKAHTPARIGLHRSGHSISTFDLLQFKEAQSVARDSVLEEWNVSRFLNKLKKLGEKPLQVATKVTNRLEYLQYPNRGKKLASSSFHKLEKVKQKNPINVAIIFTDGLSVKAIDKHGIPFWRTLKPLLEQKLKNIHFKLIVAPFGRVALSDDIGMALGAQMSVILVGERPGLSSFESLGIYLTYNPKPGNTDSQRNCISNIHPPEGLTYSSAADKLLFLMEESFRLKLSGLVIKEKNVDLLE